MTATARLLEQRSVGHVHVRMERDGIAIMREAGSAKCRCPRGTHEAILINTSGGLAGGDVVHIKGEVGAGAKLTLTSQAAERVYRTLGPPADVRVALSAGKDSTLLWLPQESIFFEDSALSRTLDVEVAEGATFLAVEPMVFGRTEMGEHINRVSVVDRWNIRLEGKLIHAEAFRLGPHWSRSQASFADNHAAATLLLVSPQADLLLDKVRHVLGPNDGASAWNGKLVARLLANDGFHLRKTLIQVLIACVGRERLPKCWTF
jgi:urease accessory protein